MPVIHRPLHWKSERARSSHMTKTRRHWHVVRIPSPNVQLDGLELAPNGRALRTFPFRALYVCEDSDAVWTKSADAFRAGVRLLQQCHVTTTGAIYLWVSTLR